MTNRGWAKLNRERGELIDKSISGALTDAEGARLDDLQALADAYLELVAPRSDKKLRRLEVRIQEMGEDEDGGPK